MLTCTLLNLTARAEKTRDLLSIYGNSVADDAAEKRKELDDAQDYYEELAAEVAYLNSFNANVESIDVEAIEKAAAEMAQTIYDIQKRLCTDVDMTIDEMLQLENELDSLRSKYDIISEAADYYGTLYTYEAPLDEVSKALQQVQVKSVEYADAVAYGEIGEVSTVKVPLNGSYYVSSYFGGRIDPLGSGKYDNHRGLDLAANTGTDVLALFSGTVVVAEYHWGMGNYVRIDHGDGIVSSYLHLSQINVEVGQQVNQYDKIGEVGGTGAWSTGPHLHLALSINGEFVDPYLLYERS